LKLDDNKIREQLSECIKGPEGLQLLMSELTQVPSSAPALAFLGTVVKDFDGIFSFALLSKIVQKLNLELTF
jgi:hypothetical protein